MKKEETAFYKNGQVKVYQSSEKELKKVAESGQKEYGIDDLVEDSVKKEEEDASDTRDE